MMQASWAWVLYAGGRHGELGEQGEVGDRGVSEAQRRWMQKVELGSVGEARDAGPLAEDEEVSMEWREVQEEESDIWRRHRIENQIQIYIKALIHLWLCLNYKQFFWLPSNKTQ